MHAFLLLAVFGFAASAVAFDPFATGTPTSTPTSSAIPTSTPTPSSYMDWVQEFPSCVQPCLIQTFNNFAVPKCGQTINSTNPNDLQCICTAKSSKSQFLSEVRKEKSCIRNACPNYFNENHSARNLRWAMGEQLMCAPYANAAPASSPYMSALLGGVGLLGTLLIL